MTGGGRFLAGVGLVAVVAFLAVRADLPNGSGRDAAISSSFPGVLQTTVSYTRNRSDSSGSHALQPSQEPEHPVARTLRNFRDAYHDCRRRLRDRDTGQPDLFACAKLAIFRQMDRFFLRSDVIRIFDCVDLVRDRDGNGTRRTGRIRLDDVLDRTWIDLVAERIHKLLVGYSLRIRLDEGEGRGRRRDHRMFAMMMMGFMIMASILVPMGFQFLTVLGGKSLLMAKMALIMSAINGLKKIATSNVGYGLYQAAPETFHHDPHHHHHHHGFHDKIYEIKAQEQPNLPFNVVV